MDERAVRTLVMLPTYNEEANIAPLIGKILGAAPDLDVVVIDDASPDGTAEKVRKAASGDPRVKLIERRGKRGRGSAGKEGFLYALGSGAEYLIEMDADFSHDPGYIPSLLETAKTCDIAVGSRFVEGASDMRGSALRRAISMFARAMIWALLGIKATDPTSGYRCFTKKALEAIDPSTLKSENPSIVLETLYRAKLRGLKVKEVPIIFRPRAAERSKLTPGILASCFFDLMRIRAAGGR